MTNDSDPWNAWQFILRTIIRCIVDNDDFKGVARRIKSCANAVYFGSQVSLLVVHRQNNRDVEFVGGGQNHKNIKRIRPSMTL